MQALLDREDLEVVEQTHADFLAGIELYRARPDKGYSLIDCISMNVMRERALTEVLTHDHNFTQEGFIFLIVTLHISEPKKALLTSSSSP